MLMNNKTELKVRDISHFLQWNTLIKFRDVEVRNRSVEIYRKLEKFDCMYSVINSVLRCCERFFEAYALLENFRKYCGLKKPVIKVEERAETVRNIYTHYSEIVAEN